MKNFLLLLFASLLVMARALGQTATVTPNPTTYAAGGGQITFTVALTFPTGAASVSLAATAPAAAWTYVSTAGAAAPDVKPNVGDTTTPSDTQSVFGWAYADVAPNATVLASGSASFSFILSYPAGLTGAQTFALTADYRVGGVLTPITIPALAIGPTPVPPTFITQPSNATVAAGAGASFTVAATGTPTPTVKWQRSVDSGTTFVDLTNDSTFGGVNTATLVVSGTTVAMNGHRFRAIATNGANPDATSSAATLSITQVPTFVTQAFTQSVVEGTSATFSVAAAGLPAPTYRWYFTPTGSSTPQALNDVAGKLAGTSTASLTVSNVQNPDVGDYVCIATNTGGTATSIAAQLAIAARVIRISGQTVAPGASFTVPVQLLATGTENAAGFSVTFDPALLTYQSAVVGAQASTASLTTNVSQTSSGRIGFLIGKQSGETWSAGTQEIIRITFLLSASAPTGALTPLGFGSTPITQEVVSASAAVLAAGYQPANISVLAGFEADMNGNGVVTAADWVRVGRIVAGLDPSPTGVDFMKADCSPRNTLGNGALTASDWVQAGRYAAGLDPLTPVGGPVGP